MSLLKAIKAQLGLSNTPANNFTITAEADNGTLKLARGNAGATTQDIFTVDANGNILVDGNNLNLFSAKSLASSGYQKLPSGMIVQWGAAATPGGATNAAVVFPLAFTTACWSVIATHGGYSSGLRDYASVSGPTTAGFTLYCSSTNMGFYWVAIGK